MCSIETCFGLSIFYLWFWRCGAYGYDGQMIIFLQYLLFLKLLQNLLETTHTQSQHLQLWDSTHFSTLNA